MLQQRDRLPALRFARFNPLACLLLAFGLVLWIPIPGHGEESAAWVRVSFRVYPMESRGWAGISYQADAQEVRTLAFRPMARSHGYAYHGPRQLEFFRLVDSPEGEVREVVAQTFLPEQASELLLFFLQEPTSSTATDGGTGRFRILAFDDSHTAFPPGHTHLLNATPWTLRGYWGNQEITLPAGGQLQQRTDRIPAEGILVALAAHDVDTTWPVFHNRLRFHPRQRTILLLLPAREATTPRIRVQRIPEYIPEPEP